MFGRISWADSAVVIVVYRGIEGQGCARVAFVFSSVSPCCNRSLEGSFVCRTTNIQNHVVPLYPLPWSSGQCSSIQLEDECVEPEYGVDALDLKVAGLSACVDLGKCASNAPCQCLQNYCTTPWYVEEGGDCREESGNMVSES